MRSTDTVTDTVLERAYIPQDGHSWGKEYTSVANDGCDIREYTPLDLPVTNTRHLFASTSHYDAADTDYAPLLRVAPDNLHRNPNGNYKPVGLLQHHGESDSMYFGLLSGSYTNNTSGGMLRKKIGTITDEIDANTGQFTATNGIVSTIDQFRIVDFRYGYDADAATADIIRDFHPTYICRMSPTPEPHACCGSGPMKTWP